MNRLHVFILPIHLIEELQSFSIAHGVSEDEALQRILSQYLNRKKTGFDVFQSRLQEVNA